MAERKLRMAVVGCGGMAGSHLRGYTRVHEAEPELFEIAALCEPVRELADKYAAGVGEMQGTAPKIYPEIGEMLAKEKLDGVDICCPHAFHHTNAISALDAGVNVMVEKPIGITVRASKAIIAAAERNGKIAATAENVRRGLSQRTAHWLLHEKGLIGTPRVFYSQHATWSEPNQERRWHWRTEKLLGGGGMVMDSGAHYCDTLRFLFGDLESAYARVGQMEPRPHVKGNTTVNDEREDHFLATLNFASGLMGVWSYCTSAPGHSFTHVVYYGSEGCLLDQGDVFHGPFSRGEVILKDGTHIPMTQLQEEFRASLGEEGNRRLFPHDWTDGVTLEVYDYMTAIRDGRAPEVDGATGLKAKTIAETIYESAHCGQAVRYADVLSGKVDAYQREIDQKWGL